MQVEAHEYERLRSWLGHVARQALPPSLMSPETDPVAALDRLAVNSPAKARKGLSMAINDLVELTTTWPDEQVAATDRLLLENGLPSLTEVRARFSKAVQRVLRRERIASEVEYYAVRNAAELPGERREQLWALLAGYEQQRAS
ncbi:hypothetical protein [Caulobacter sp. 17J80-11]|uniref:hypothetical protein n=1 Tax=Caulobacter sp. 17J80-11 TaxID=2763502 RepID=UPI00165386E1|nr:hypothetical protein [Caulobacter sp. 17J80-11]MBC6981374.1 hypothetical protein [Caulobacter sp. 17J80-11]